MSSLVSTYHAFLGVQKVGNPLGLFFQPFLYGVWAQVLVIREWLACQLETFGNILFANRLIPLSKHLLLEQAWFEDVLELGLAAFAFFFLVCSFLLFNCPVVFCAIAECRPVVFLGALIETRELQSPADVGDTRLSDFVVVLLNLVFELVLFDEVGELIYVSSPTGVRVFDLFVVGEDIIDGARSLGTFLVTALQALELALRLLAPVHGDRDATVPVVVRGAPPPHR
jgi:hypothetical protein